LKTSFRVASTTTTLLIVEVIMKHLLCSLAILLLFTGSTSYSRNRIAQQRPEDEVIAQGNPPLTVGRVDQLAEFFEWALDSKFTKSQRTLFTARLVEIWEKRDQSSIDAFMNMRKSYDSLANVTPEQSNEARGKIQTLLLDVFVKNSADSLAQLLLSVYKASHPGAVITPNNQAAANPPAVPARVPAELVGEWIARRGSGSSYINPNTGQTGGVNATIDSYKIFANGSYEHSIFIQSSLYNCTLTTVGRETGPISVQASTFSLTPGPGTLDSKNSCNPSLNEKQQTNFDPATYSWRIQRNEYGLELCLQPRGDSKSTCYQKQ
jgi:hypothetical protein